MPRRRRADDDLDVFPDYHFEYASAERGEPPLIQRITAEGGLSLRDFYAGQALTGLLAQGQNEDLCAKSYAIADRMLEERSQGGA